MKRSEVNEILRQSDAFMRSFNVALPPFAYWTPERLRQDDATMIRARGLGWDITDFGQGRFDELGLFLFTTRNGQHEDLRAGKGMVYAEKVMISRKDQVTPMHRHVLKTEDIINRGGGDLILELFHTDADGGINRNADVTVLSDGLAQTLPAGGHLRLSPGASVTLEPDTWHAFWADKKDCLIVEVSTVNDDKTDNLFEMDIGRFSSIEEDETPLHLLVSDY